MNTVFVASWCCEGLEGLFNWSAHEQQQLMNVLQDKPQVKNSAVINSMILRARYNPQRFYEVYAFNSSVSEEDIREMFETAPQAIVDWIRKHGTKLHSDRQTKKQRVVIE